MDIFEAFSKFIELKLKLILKDFLKATMLNFVYFILISWVLKTIFNNKQMQTRTIICIFY